MCCLPSGYVVSWWFSHSCHWILYSCPENRACLLSSEASSQKFLQSFWLPYRPPLDTRVWYCYHRRTITLWTIFPRCFRLLRTDFMVSVQNPRPLGWMNIIRTKIALIEHILTKPCGDVHIVFLDLFHNYKFSQGRNNLTKKIHLFSCDLHEHFILRLCI